LRLVAKDVYERNYFGYNGSLSARIRIPIEERVAQQMLLHLQQLQGPKSVSNSKFPKFFISELTIP